MYSVKRVSKMKSIFSVVYHAVCWQIIPFSFDECGHICTESYHHYHIGNMNYWPLFIIRPWNNGIRFIFWNNAPVQTIGKGRTFSIHFHPVYITRHDVFYEFSIGTVSNMTCRSCPLQVSMTYLFVTMIRQANKWENCVYSYDFTAQTPFKQKHNTPPPPQTSSNSNSNGSGNGAIKPIFIESVTRGAALRSNER